MYSDWQALAAAGRRRMHTDIHTACWNGDIELVQQFIDVDTRLVNSPDTTEYGNQMRPLHYAAYQVSYKAQCTI
jgi:hypothetical protein